MTVYNGCQDPNCRCKTEENERLFNEGERLYRNVWDALDAYVEYIGNDDLETNETFDMLWEWIADKVREDD